MRGRVFISEIWWYFAWSYYSAERVKMGYAERASEEEKRRKEKIRDVLSECRWAEAPAASQKGSYGLKIWRLMMERPRVSSSAYSRSSPKPRPRASEETLTPYWAIWR